MQVVVEVEQVVAHLIVVLIQQEQEDLEEVEQDRQEALQQHQEQLTLEVVVEVEEHLEIVEYLHLHQVDLEDRVLLL
jgi:hypothetical protein